VRPCAPGSDKNVSSVKLHFVKRGRECGWVQT
jgi:hypothetical protein